MFQLNEILGRRVPLKIVSFFLKRPNGEFSETEVRKMLKLSRLSANKWLRTLHRNRILGRAAKGRMMIYRLNHANAVVIQLKVLDNVAFASPFFSDLKGVEIFLYGSSARGEDREDSDIDLLVIGRRNRDVVSAIRKMDSSTDRRIKPSFYTEFEWSQMARKDAPFYERVERDKIRLV